jgi:flagellar hook-associated protein 2
MATVSSLGIGSGIDVSSLISGLMSVERAPLTEISTKESKTQSQISALGKIKSALSSLATAATKFTSTGSVTAYSATLTKDSTTDKTVATATTASYATAGTYNINVTKLAVQAKSTSDAVFSSSSAELTAGSTFSVSTAGGAAVNIDITSGMTLADLKASINSNSDMGVTASIINADSGAKLVLTAKKAGDSITTGGTLGSFSTTLAGQKAELTIDGQAITATSNTIDSALPGITLSLTNTGSSTMTVAADSSSLSTTVNELLTAYNNVNSQVKTLTKYDASTKTAAVLTGDSTANAALNQIRSVLSSSPSGTSGTYSSLSSIGISVQTDGSLALDSTKFAAALEKDSGSVMSVLSAYGSALKTSAKSLTDTEGIIAKRTEGLNSRLTDLSAQRDRLNTRLTMIQKTYEKQFSAMDTMVSSMNSSLSYISKLG